MKAIVLCGGFGTRLREIIKDVPKPMAPVAGRPFLEYLILQLTRWNIRDIVLSIGYKGEIIRSYFGNGRKWGIKITYSEEDRPLGTGGALKKAAQLTDNEQFVVMNGDSFLDVDFMEFFRFHRKKEASATIALAHVENVERYGSVAVNEENEICEFSEKVLSKHGLINGGIYIFNRNIIEILPDRNFSLEKVFLPKIIGQGLYGIDFNRFFIDIGVPEDYLRICREPGRLLDVVRPAP